MKISPHDSADPLYWLECYKKAIDVNIITSITDASGRIVYVNDKFCEVSQFSRKELIGKSHNIINSGYHSDSFFANLWKTIKAGKIWNGEVRNRTKSGSFYWVDTVIIPVKLDAGVQYLSLRLIITEKKELEEKREEYIKSLEDLLFMTSHRVRSPLTAMKGLSLLDADNISKEDLKLVQGYLKSSIDDLDNFTKEMTQYLCDLKELFKR